MNINNPTTFSVPDLTFTTSNSSGTSGALRADDSLLLYDTTLPDAIAYGQSGATGSAATAARRDHSHQMAALDQVDAATRAEMEAGSSTSVFASPGRTQYHPGVAKAWGQHNSAGTLQSPSYNMTSTAKASTGEYTITWDTPFSGTVYSFEYTARSLAYRATYQSMAAASITGRMSNTSDSAADSEGNFAAWGDQ